MDWTDVSEVIRAAAVQGSFIDLDVLAAVTQRSAVSLDDPLRRCVTAGLLEEHAGDWRWRSTNASVPSARLAAQVYRKLEIDGRTRLVSVATAEFKGSAI